MAPVRRPYRPPRSSIGPHNETGRTDNRHTPGSDVLDFRFRVLQVRRKGDPKLKTLDRGRRASREFLAVPHAPSGTDPLDAAVAYGSVPHVRILQGHVYIREYSDRCYAGMRMYRHTSCHVAHVSFEHVEKTARLH